MLLRSLTTTARVAAFHPYVHEMLLTRFCISGIVEI
jgi:hypothetical protein